MVCNNSRCILRKFGIVGNRLQKVSERPETPLGFPGLENLFSPFENSRRVSESISGRNLGL